MTDAVNLQKRRLLTLAGSATLVASAALVGCRLPARPTAVRYPTNP